MGRLFQILRLLQSVAETIDWSRVGRDPLAGWTHGGSCSAAWPTDRDDRGTAIQYMNAPVQPELLCLDFQSDGGQIDTFPATSARVWRRWEYKPPFNGLIRRRCEAVYGAPGAITERPPETRTVALPRSHPVELGRFHSQYLPIQKTGPGPRPLPLDVKRRDDPLENDDAGNETPDAQDRRLEEFANRRWPEQNFARKTATSMLQVEKHWPTKVGERVKEKKFAGTSELAQQILRVAARAKESATELNDFLDVITDSLPKKLQDVPHTGKFATPQEKIAHIYKHVNEIDPMEFAKNFAMNYLEDLAVGAAIDYANRATKALSDSAKLKIRGTFLSPLPKW